MKLLQSLVPGCDKVRISLFFLFFLFPFSIFLSFSSGYKGKVSSLRSSNQLDVSIIAYMSCLFLLGKMSFIKNKNKKRE